MKRKTIIIPRDCIHVEHIETDYDVISGHSDYTSMCRRTEPAVSTNDYKCSRCRHMETEKIAVPITAIAVEARNWLSEATIVGFLKPIIDIGGTIEMPPLIPTTDKIRFLFGGGQVKLDILTNEPMPKDIGLPDDLIELINYAVERKVDTIEFRWDYDPNKQKGN